MDISICNYAQQIWECEIFALLWWILSICYHLSHLPLMQTVLWNRDGLERTGDTAGRQWYVPPSWLTTERSSSTRITRFEASSEITAFCQVQIIVYSHRTLFLSSDWEEIVWKGRSSRELISNPRINRGEKSALEGEQSRTSTKTSKEQRFNDSRKETLQLPPSSFFVHSIALRR